MTEKNSRATGAAAIKQLLVASLMLIIQMTIFFISAGDINIPRPWIYFAAGFAHYSVSTALVYKLNPELLVQRLKRKREGSKAWDEMLMRISNLTVILVIPAVAGYDLRRSYQSNLDIPFVLVGLMSLIISTALISWAMIVNPHFEPTVRIQKDRDHRVITTGPYKIVRHPGYLAGILLALSIPLIIGSVLAFIPVGIYVILTMVRTSLEDKTLNEELGGYSEYAKRVRRRIFPGIW